MAMRTVMTNWISSQLVLHDLTTILRFKAGYIEGGKQWIVYILHQKKKLFRLLAMAGTRPSGEEVTTKNTTI